MEATPRQFQARPERVESIFATDLVAYEQSDMLSWHIDSVVKCGLAGTILFTWTDEWFTGGEEITDWAFGIVTRERKPKKAFYRLEEKLGQSNSIAPHQPLPRSPFVSTRGGGSTSFPSSST